MAGWGHVVQANAATPVAGRRLVRQLQACEASAIAAITSGAMRPPERRVLVP